MQHIVIARSKKLLVYLIVLHSVMLATLVSLFAMSWYSVLAALIVLASFIYYGRQYQWLKAKRSLIRVEYDVDKGWSLHYSDASQQSRLNLTSSFVTPQLVMLYFNHRYFLQGNVVTIIDDAVDPELFRQLRVYLRSPNTFRQ